MASEIKMSGKQRFLCALNHQEADYVPLFEYVFSQKFFKHVLGYAPEVFDAVEVAKLSHKVGYDITTVGLGSGFTCESVGDIYQDEWGTTYKKDPIAWPTDAPIAYPLKDGEDWKNYTMPDVTLESRYAPVIDAVKVSAEYGLGLMADVRGPFSGSWMLFGLEDFCVMFYTEPETVEAVMKAYTDYTIYACLKLVELGVDCISIADDYGSNLAPFMSPEHFKQYIAPHLNRLVNAVHKAGGKIVIHCDGQIMPVLPYIVEAGMDGLNPIQRGAGMDLATVKNLYGHQLCLMGNVDQRDLMVNGTKEEVMEQAKECIRIAAPGGGFCLGSDHSVHDDIPIENILAIIEAGRTYGKYPLCL